MVRRAFTAIELLLVIVVVAILVVASLPNPDTVASQRGINFAIRLEADIAYAQSLSVADPGDPAVLRVDTDANTYWLEKTSAPGTPIPHPVTGEPYLVAAGGSTEYGFQGVQITAIDFNGDDALSFDGTGGIDQDVPAVVQLSSGGSAFDVTLSATTGTSSTRSMTAEEFDTGLPSVH